MNKRIPFIFFIGNNIFRNFIGLVRAKILAIFWGVSHIGILGQLLTFYNFQTKIVLFGTKISLINLLNSEEIENERGIIASSFLIIFASNIIFLSILFLFANSISIYLFRSIEYVDLVKLIGIIGPIYTFKDFIESLLQAKKKFSVLAKGQFYGLLLALFLIFPLIYYLGVFGALYNFIVWFLVSILYYLYREPKIIIHFFDFKYIKTNFGKVFKIALLNVIRHVSIAFSFLVFRIIIVQSLDIIQAAYFQAIWGVINYIDVLVTGFTFYLLPTISHLSKSPKLNAELKKNFEILIHIIYPIIMFIILLPSTILIILFSKDFMHLSFLLSIMAIGKVFESIYLFFIVVLVGQMKFKYYFIFDIIKSLLIIIIPYSLIYLYGFEGSIAGIVLVNYVTFIMILIYVKKIKMFKIDKIIIFNIIKFITGLVILIFIPSDTIFFMAIKFIFGIVILYLTIDYRKYSIFISIIKSKLLK